MWKTALQDENLKWEVMWSPAAEGWDRRMWTRYLTLVTELAQKLGKEPSKEETIKCLTDILKTNNIAVEHVFMLGAPVIMGVGAVLIHPRQVDVLVRQCSINTHNIRPERLQLIITGMSAYKNIEPYLLKYLNRFANNDGIPLAGYRTPEGYHDLMVFHVTSWDATHRVLANHENFP
ncbi:hypothetical protein DFH09DRAFT_1072473 [Mycena vulgaris]|nr:hypothetical protein DFH09DRAFT_1072473 [Mycena vulgaris]